MIYDSTSAHLAARAAGFGMDARITTIAQALAEAGTWKPGGAAAYGLQIAKRRRYSRAQQLQDATEVLKAYFKKGWAGMVPHVVPLFKHEVDNASTLYRYPPNRNLVNGDVVNKAETDQMLRVYRDAMVDAEMHGGERISYAGRVCFIRGGWDGFEERVTLSKFWPDRIHVVCDPQYPDKLNRAQCLFAEILGPDGLDPYGAKTYEVWQRVAKGWARSVVAGDGATWKPGELEAQQVFPFLPWVAIHYEDPEGLLFPELPTDDIAAVDSITAGYSNRDHIINMQAHAQRWATGPEIDKKVAEWNTGPDEVWTAVAGSFGELGGNPQIAAVDDALQKTIERELLLLGLSPVGATVDTKYMSADGMRHIDKRRDETRQDRLPFARLTEEKYLWPMMRAIVEHYSKGKIRFSDGVEMRVSYGKLASTTPTDWDQSFKLIDANASTLPAEMVKHGHAQTESQALEMLKANAETNAEVSALAGSDSANLNGAQLAELGGVLVRVVTGMQPPEEAIAMISTTLPITEEKAREIVGRMGSTFKVDPAQVKAAGV